MCPKCDDFAKELLDGHIDPLLTTVDGFHTTSLKKTKTGVNISSENKTIIGLYGDTVYWARR